MFKFTVSSNQKITPSTILISLKIKDKQPYFNYRPGQYAVMSYRRHLRPTPMRCFSIVSSPTEPGILQLSMRVRGHFTRGLTNLKAGDPVTIVGPFGGFVFDENRDQKVVLMAGGIGITPYMSMLRYATALKLSNEFRLLLSSTTQEEVPFLDELRELEHKNPHIKVLHFIGSGPTNHLSKDRVYEGRISEKVLDDVSANNYFDKSYFICGSPPFMKGMLGTLRKKGVPRKNIMTEAFSQGANRQTGKIHDWPATVYIASSIGLAAASVAVTFTDFFRTLPPSTILAAVKNRVVNSPTNSRQQDLDKLVNSNAVTTNSAPASAATVPPVEVKVVYITSGSSTSTKSSPVTTTTTAPSSTTATTQATTPAQTPVTKPAPAPVCTTSPSGVTTCK